MRTKKTGAEAPVFLLIYLRETDQRMLEREKRLELSTYTLARYRSTN